MKQFTTADIVHGGISAERTELVYAPLAWQKQGLQETASGYGLRLNSGYRIHFNGKLYRCYVTQISNAGSVWFKAKGQTIYVR